MAFEGVELTTSDHANGRPLSRYGLWPTTIEGRYKDGYTHSWNPERIAREETKESKLRMTGQRLEFDAGSSVLVLAQSLDEVGRTTGPELLSGTTGSAVIAVTYDRSAESMLRTWRPNGETEPDVLHVIDVNGTQPSTGGETTSGIQTRDVVTAVQRPDDLLGVRVAIESALAETEGKATLVFDSLTAPSEYVSLDELVVFLDTVSSLLDETDSVGYFFLDESVNDEAAIGTLRTVTDETVELTDESGPLVPAAAPSFPDGLSIDVLFEVLKSRRRRDALRYLFEADTAVTEEELASGVARLAPDGTELTGTDHGRDYSTLFQLHLPKLADAGLIDHDEANRLVTVHEEALWAEPFLALVNE